MCEIIQFPLARVVRIAPAWQPDVRVDAFGSDVDLIDKWAAAKSYLHGSYDVPSDTEMM